MNYKQVDLYNKNIIAIARAIQIVGGDVSNLLADNFKLIDTLSRNGLEISFKLYPSIDN
jgi:hypothetical protein